MDALTVEAITAIASQVDDLILHPTTINYIQLLLTPYAKILEDAQDMAGIMTRVPYALLELLGEHVLIRFNELIKQRIEEERSDGQCDPATIDDIKRTVMKDIVENLVFGPFVSGDNTTPGLPWDVLSCINNNDLTTFFGIIPGTNTLPVTLTIDTESFECLLTEEFTMGLLLFSFTEHVDFHITIFGVPLLTDYFKNKDRIGRPSKYNHTLRNPSELKFTNTDIKYKFNAPDFAKISE